MIRFVLKHMSHKILENFLMNIAALVEPRRLDFPKAQRLCIHDIVARPNALATFPQSDGFANTRVFRVDDYLVKYFQVWAVRRWLYADHAQRQTYNRLAAQPARHRMISVDLYSEYSQLDPGYRSTIYPLAPLAASPHAKLDYQCG